MDTTIFKGFMGVKITYDFKSSLTDLINRIILKPGKEKSGRIAVAIVSIFDDGWFLKETIYKSNIILISYKYSARPLVLWVDAKVRRRQA